MLVSRYFPCTWLGYYPNERVLLATYEAKFAADLGKRARDVFIATGKELFGLEVRKDTKAATHWSIQGHEGGMQTAGAGGPITGKGADCVAEGTVVQTNKGSIHIEDLQSLPVPVKIMCYGEHGIEFKAIQAIRRIEGRRLLRITTTSGRSLDVTPDHQVYSNGKYVEANVLSAGDPLLLAVQKKTYCSSIRTIQKAKTRMCGQLLFCRMFEDSSFDKKPATVQSLQIASQEENQGILRVMQTKGQGKNANISCKRNRLSNLQQHFYGSMEGQISRKTCNLLQQVLCPESTFEKDGRDWESEVEAWGNPTPKTTTFSEGISTDAANRFGERQKKVRGVQFTEKSSRSSHRWMADEQRIREPGYIMFQVPSHSPCSAGFKAVKDSVAMVKRVRQTSVVYDIQVEENRNFFANGILVHNCLILDDLVKNAEEANSYTQREHMWEWLESVAMTRLEPKGVVVIITTRWNRDDVCGRLLDRQPADWTVISLPAIAEENDILGRKPGEALWPERWPIEELELIKRKISRYWWSALYQQHPMPRTGILFSMDNIQKWKIETFPTDIHYCRGWDLASSEKQVNKSDPDYTAGTLAGIDTRPEVPILYVKDVVRGQWGAPERDAMIKRTAMKDGPAVRVFVEKVGAYKEAAERVQKLLAGIAIVETISPTKDKVTRADFLTPCFSAGNVVIAEDDWNEQWINEFTEFPEGVHDDQVDSLALCTHEYDVFSEFGFSI